MAGAAEACGRPRTGPGGRSSGCVDLACLQPQLWAPTPVHLSVGNRSWASAPSLLVSHPHRKSRCRKQHWPAPAPDPEQWLRRTHLLRIPTQDCLEVCGRIRDWFWQASVWGDPGLSPQPRLGKELTPRSSWKMKASFLLHLTASSSLSKPVT